jgi:hypothetical protein
VNIEFMRACVQRRRLLASHAELARRLDALEKTYDAQVTVVVVKAIRQRMVPPDGAALDSLPGGAAGVPGEPAGATRPRGNGEGERCEAGVKESRDRRNAGTGKEP